MHADVWASHSEVAEMMALQYEGMGSSCHKTHTTTPLTASAQTIKTIPNKFAALTHEDD